MKKLYRIDVPEFNTGYALIADSAKDAEDELMKYLKEIYEDDAVFDSLVLSTCEQNIVDFPLEF